MYNDARSNKHWMEIYFALPYVSMAFMETTFKFAFINGLSLGIYGPLTKTVVNLSPSLYINNVMMIQ